MAKVYNKKKGMYKGSLPGMRMGGTLRKAQTGDQGQFVDEYGDTLSPELSEDMIMKLENQGLSPNEIEDINKNPMFDEYQKQFNREDSLYNVREHVMDSLATDRRLKEGIQEMKSTADSRQLEIDCARGNKQACIQLNKQYDTSYYEPGFTTSYKKGGVVKKKRGGTILGGKYKMKKGGSLGRNGIL